MSKNEKLPENIKSEMIGEKRYVRINEGAKRYSVSPNTFRMMAAGFIEKKNMGIAKASVFYVMNFICEDETTEEKQGLDSSEERAGIVSAEEDAVFRI